MTAGVLRLGRYRAEALLGTGGVTETYRARLWDASGAEAERIFALKLLRADRGGDSPDVVGAFMAAAQRLAETRLPGVARVIDVAPGPDPVYSASELIEGKDVTAYAAHGGGMDIAAVARIGAAAAARLASLSDGGLPAHGSICPGNVFIRPSGDVVLLDAGLTASIRLLTEHPIDKWLYVAPELLVGDDPSPASDLYSLGATLFFLVTGRPPFEAETRDDLQALMAAGPPLLPDLPQPFAALLRGLLTPDPALRPSSAADLARALSVVAGTPEGDMAALASAVMPTSAVPLQPIDAPAPFPLADGLPTFSETALASPDATEGEFDDVAVAVVTREVNGIASEPASQPEPSQPSASWAERLPASADTGDANGRTPFGVPVNYNDPNIGVVYDEGDESAFKPAKAGKGGVAVVIPMAAGRRFRNRGMLGAAGILLLLVGAVIFGWRKLVPPPPRPIAKQGTSARTTPAEISAPKEPTTRGQIKVSTTPMGAMVWIDGLERGRTPIDTKVNPGGHRLVLVKPGYRMLRETIDASEGAIISRTLEPVLARDEGPVTLNVICQTTDKYPVFVDNKETGSLCPAEGLKIQPGTRHVGVFVIPENRIWSFERDIPPNASTHRVIFGY